MLLQEEMKTALIGHTGFVGSNLARQHAFTDTFNRANIASIAGQEFDLIVCSGISAVKWWANQNPEADWAGIEALLKPLSQARARKFVLISTVDVYPLPLQVDESTPLDGVENHAYGRHRYRAECLLRERFADTQVVRLPGLFGEGLKKNVIFDLLNDNQLENIQPESSFQYYSLHRIWSDLERVMATKLPLVNFAAEPVRTTEIIERFFPGKSVGQKAGPAGRYDMHSRHAAHWGRSGPYLFGKEEIFGALAQLLANQRPSGHKNR
jgi:hypothetical protein